MDRRVILNEINAAFDAKAMLEAQQAGEQPVEVEVAGKIGQLFAALRGAFTLMGEINEIWAANDMTQRIVAAAMAGETLAGYSPATWATWGAITPRITGFIATEYVAQMPDSTTRTETPKTVLLRRYTQEG